MSSFTPSALSERTLKQFVDRLTKLRSGQPAPKSWPPKRAAIQEEIAHILGFSSWHQAIHAVRPTSAVGQTPAPAATPAEIHQQVDQELMYRNEPARWEGHHLDDLLAWAAGLGASDVVFTSNEKIIIELYGRMRRVTKREMDNAEVVALVNHMMGKPVVDSTSVDVDLAYVAKAGAATHRFRVNATTIFSDGQYGLQITMRAVAQTPPLLETLHAPDDLAVVMRTCRSGMIVVSGGTGSGKSTLLSAVVRDVLEHQTNKKVITYEDPIEYEYSSIDTDSSNLLTQKDISGSKQGYAPSILAGMRRKPSHIVIGQARDPETIGKALDAAMTGHCVFTTMQASGCANTLWRMISCFPRDEQRGRFVDALSSVRAVVCMRLVPDTQGKRVALFEHLVLDDALADRLIDGGMETLVASVDAILVERGADFASDARRKHQAGLISAFELDRCVRDQRRRRG